MWLKTTNGRQTHICSTTSLICLLTSEIVFEGNSRRVKTVETLQFLQRTKVLEHRQIFYTSDERNSTREHAHVCNLKGINFGGLPITHEKPRKFKHLENLYSYGISSALVEADNDAQSHLICRTLCK